MPLPAPYQTFSELLGEGKAIGKSRETDKILNLLTDQIINFGSIQTRTNRISAMMEYLLSKRSLILFTLRGIGVNAAPVVRNSLKTLSLTSSLIQNGTITFNQAGRFHRVLLSVINEVDTNAEFVVLSDWCNLATLAINEQSNFNVPPVVADYSAYYINDAQSNDGGTIEVAIGTPIYLYTAGINFTGHEWFKDSSATGVTEEDFFLNPVGVGDSGVYEQRYTNSFGTTVSPTFTLNVT